jgi:hypothetical protein
MITPEHIISAHDIAKLRAAGFAIVPREATEAMHASGYYQRYIGAPLLVVYRAMVDAAEAELIHQHTTQALAFRGCQNHRAGRRRRSGNS